MTTSHDAPHTLEVNGIAYLASVGSAGVGATTTSGVGWVRLGSPLPLPDLVRTRFSLAPSNAFRSLRCSCAIRSIHGASIVSHVHHFNLGLDPFLRFTIGKPRCQYQLSTVSCELTLMARPMAWSPQ
jgi:hypothetical protein